MRVRTVRVCFLQGEKGVDGPPGEFGDMGKKGDKGMEVRLRKSACTCKIITIGEATSVYNSNTCVNYLLPPPVDKKH